MPTYRASASSRSRAPAGFTLLELMLVLAVMGLAMFLAVPAFQNLLQRDVDREVSRLAGVLRLLRNEAILTRTRYQIVFDLKEGDYRVEAQSGAGDPIPVTDVKMLLPHAFPGTWDLKQIYLYGDKSNPLADREVPVVVDSSGFVDPFALQFSDGSNPYTIFVEGMLGKTELLEGHVVEKPR